MSFLNLHFSEFRIIVLLCYIMKILFHFFSLPLILLTYHRNCFFICIFSSEFHDCLLPSYGSVPKYIWQDKRQIQTDFHRILFSSIFGLTRVKIQTDVDQHSLHFCFGDIMDGYRLDLNHFFGRFWESLAVHQPRHRVLDEIIGSLVIIIIFYREVLTSDIVPCLCQSHIAINLLNCTWIGLTTEEGELESSWKH